MNKYELLFYTSFLWILVGTVLALVLGNIIFMIIIFFILPQFIIAAFYGAGHDIKIEDQKIADYMKEERVFREQS